MRLSVRLSSSLRAEGFTSMAYLATQAAALDQVGFDASEGNALFLAPPFRDQAVVEILPERPMLAKIDLHGHLAAFLVGEKLDADHGVPLFACLDITLVRLLCPVKGRVCSRPFRHVV